MTLTKKLDKLLLINDLSIAELSRGADIPDATLRSLYKFGADNIKLSNLRKLATFFNVSLDYLADNSIDTDIAAKITLTFTSDEYTHQELKKIRQYATSIIEKR